MKEFLMGAKNGMPIGLGYLSVSFGIGILAAQYGLSTLIATLVSATNLTSAGQAAGLAVIAAGGTIIEMILTQFVINLRYALMGISLSQRLSPAFTTKHRFLAAFGITDEIFAVASTRAKPVTPAFMYGLISVSFIGWVGGTFIGASAGHLLPTQIVNAMGITLYGMFLAIMIPPAKKNGGVLFVIILTAALSVAFKFLLPMISSGFTVIICAVLSSIIGALLFPVTKKEEDTV